MDESERLRQLRLYRVLDTAQERAFDDFTALAASICATPISLVSLVDQERQWFKSRVGLAATETPRAVAFCAHAIQRPEDLFVVEDARRDSRFASNPLVTGDLGIRFYAGAPLQVEGGAALGTLCVIDRRPRRLSANQREALRVLSRAVVGQLELRRIRIELQGASSLLPLCAWCRSVRTDAGAWLTAEAYLTKDQPLTHGICPACAPRVEAELRAQPPPAPPA